MNDIERQSINTIRTLSIDAVQQAESGHPGAPMALAPAAYVLWKRHMNYNPANPGWANRDRFVLSNGHASMLLYAMLHLTGFEEMTLDEIEDFRQWGSVTPGHPEVHLTDGVETTTGPLGQGFANGVGMAVAEARLNQEFDGLIDHYTYAFCSDGDVMEGISHEAASLAGHLELDKLVYIYDDNEITIDGRTDITFSEDVRQRFDAYGWHTAQVRDGNDLEAIDDAITEAKATDRPSIIALETTIGYGSPNKADTSAAHGAPLGPEEVERTKEKLGWEHDEPFFVPDEVREHMDHRDEGDQLESAWREQLATFESESPERHAELERRLAGELPDGWDDDLPTYEPSESGQPTRNANGDVLDDLYAAVPELMGGSADLAGSNRTLNEEFGVVEAGNYDAQNMHFGVREHGMCGIVNGMNLHGGVRGFGATFLIFSDYMRPSLRLAALMEQPTTMVFTHDSIGLGEDGPTHQPIEQLASLRAIPNLSVFRPADAAEVPDCWREAVAKQDGPSALVFTRQNVPVVDRDAHEQIGDPSRGGYVIADAPEGDPDVILLATGSEVPICVDARDQLADDGIAARVVSMPSWELFEQQGEEWRETVLPSEVSARLAVEAAAPQGWDRWVGDEGDVLGIDRFGASAPYEDNYEQFGFTPENVADRARQLVD
jgi:transketolase